LTSQESLEQSFARIRGRNLAVEIFAVEIFSGKVPRAGAVELTRRVESFLLEMALRNFRQLGLSTFREICLQSTTSSGETAHVSHTCIEKLRMSRTAVLRRFGCG
jgi:hypothetical protein